MNAPTLSILSLCLLLFAACSSDTKTPSADKEQPTEDTATLSKSPTQKATTGSWRGIYTFTDVGPKNSGQVQEYRITVKKKGSDHSAMLEVDGFQAHVRAACKVAATADSISFQLDQYLDDSMKPYKDGSHLLSLKRTPDGKLLTYWDGAQAELKSCGNGGECFRKEKGTKSEEMEDGGEEILLLPKP